MSQLVEGRDAAFPQNLTGYTGTILGYYGGPRAYNAWTAKQWAEFKNNPKIPIWVGGFSGREADDAVKVLKKLGANDCVTLLDMETRVDKTYVASFGLTMHKAGYKVWVYGSVSTLFKNPQLNGYAPADPTGTPHLYTHLGVRMTQYAFGTQYDDDVIRKWVYEDDTIWK